MRGARYLAEERGAFEIAEPLAPVLVIETAPAVASAPLYEVAAAHDGQPPVEWLGMFMQVFESEK